MYKPLDVQTSPTSVHLDQPTDATHALTKTKLLHKSLLRALPLPTWYTLLIDTPLSKHSFLFLTSDIHQIPGSPT